jgi:general secretion pathway protein N
VRRRVLLAIGLALYVLALTASVPATFVDTMLQRLSDGRVRLAAGRGTLWSGAGQIELIDGSRQAGIATPLAWRFAATSLLRGILICELKLAETASFPVRISLSGIDVENADIALPASALGAGVRSLAVLRPTGDLLLHVRHLSLANTSVRGSVIVEWRNAGSALSRVSPLGSYELRVDANGVAAHGVLRTTLHGPLELSGQGSWQKGQAPRIAVTAHVMPESEAQLAPLLRLIAIEKRKGDFELKVNWTE